MRDAIARARFVLYSAIGIAVFFVPLTFNGRSTIVLDHIVRFANGDFPTFSNLFCVGLILYGVFAPFLTGAWKASRTSIVMSIVQIAALFFTAMYFLERGPQAIMDPGMLPFLFDKLAVPVGLIIPVGAVFLSFLIGFGFLEAIGTVMEPVMRVFWKTPGRSAVDAVASFAGSYSVGLIITNRVYKAGGYSAREAAIIATGFSTVSVTFMVVVARTLELTDVWHAYFWSTLFVTFVVTAIVVRLPPLSRFDNSRQIADGVPHEVSTELRTIPARAWYEGVQVAGAARPLTSMLRDNFIEGLLMASRVVPSILSIGMLGLLATKYTPLFDILGYLIYPAVWISRLAEPGLVSSALASGLAEMFLPAIQTTHLPDATRFTVGVVSVSSILFFSASIPCVLATEIPINVWQMLVIWFQRTLISIPVAALLGHFFMGS